jgi:hypothetical protein
LLVSEAKLAEGFSMMCQCERVCGKVGTVNAAVGSDASGVNSQMGFDKGNSHLVTTFTMALHALALGFCFGEGWKRRGEGRKGTEGERDQKQEGEGEDECDEEEERRRWGYSEGRVTVRRW